MDETNQPQDGEQPVDGLLDNISIEEVQEEGAEPQEISHLKAEPDETPAERPEWFPENFWKKDDAAPDMEAMAKSWTDLRKQISQGKHKAPEDGNYDMSSFSSTPEDDPVRGHVAAWAKEYGLSQAALDGLVGPIVEMTGQQQQQVQFDAAAEKKALGPNADSMIKGMTEWGAGLVNKGIWGKDDFEEFKIMGGTANGIKALMKLRETYEGRIPTNSTPIDGAPSKTELNAMVGDPKYQTDPAYRQKVERLFNQVYGD
tara:strand:- start:11047 stop:11820 length:774 start_codon:yes stop_codon:yes gene_type:complete